jgi:uncharacterized protein YqcC (DUF446 family)
MDDNARDISDALMAIEAQLRILSLWESEPPSTEDLLSDQPFCCDTLAFPQWLQWILLPRMWEIVEQGGPYPQHCGIYAYAEEWAMHQDQAMDSLGLLTVLWRFDGLIEVRSGLERH